MEFLMCKFDYGFGVCLDYLQWSFPNAMYYIFFVENLQSFCE